MGRIRVLLVDDAVVIRRLLADVLAADPDLEVVGVAPDGRIALAKIPQVNPDVVILDVEMPVLDGLGTLTELRRTHPRLPVIMFSTLTERGAATTLDALARGATDYVTKPANVGSVVAAQQRVRDELIPKIKALCGRAARPRTGPATQPAPPTGAGGVPPAIRRGPVLPAEIVAIGVSTGGPNALAAAIPELPADLAVPVVIVQHMPPLFTRLLAERLAAKARIRVREAEPGMALEPGLALLAPGDWHMEVERVGVAVRVRLHQGPPENSCRPAADVLFRSVAAAYGPRSLGIVLTGMGQDGFRGAQAIREAGGQVLAQDEETSVVWGMPGYVAAAGLADRVLPLGGIAGEIVRRVARPLPAGRSA